MNCTWTDVIADGADMAYAREQMRRWRQWRARAGVREFQCAVCGKANVTTDKRKRYCDEYCRNKTQNRAVAERMRNYRARLRKKMAENQAEKT
jgi:predicted nucleic acid-binding Zn ribbon protein